MAIGSARNILVTGATGVLGSVVVTELARRGHRVRAMTRRAVVDTPRAERVRADLVSGEGLSEAVSGTDTIVHAATDGMRHKAVDEEGTSRLLEIAAAAGNPHVIYVSIVGIDQIPYTYYKSKLEAERLVTESGLPCTVLRATQFHDLVLTLIQQFARPPLVVVPRLRLQPVDVRDVAGRLGELVAAGPSGRVADFGGPATFRGVALMRRYLAHVGVRRRVTEAALPGPVFRALREGHNLVPEPAGGTRDFGAYLREQTVVEDGRVLVASPYADRWAGEP